jgi:hypothetical protein
MQTNLIGRWSPPKLTLYTFGKWAPFLGFYHDKIILHSCLVRAIRVQNDRRRHEFVIVTLDR